MNSNTHSNHAAGGLADLVAALEKLATQDPDRLADGVRAERVLVLRGLVDRLEGHWLQELAAVDARGAAGAEEGIQAPSTAGWLRSRLRMGPGAASNAVRTARALFRGPLAATAAALTEATISPAHAAMVAHGTHDLPGEVAVEAEPVLLEAARRLDPPRLRKVLGHLRVVADPDGERDQTEERHGRRGLWLAATWEGMVAVEGLLEAEAGQTLLAALEPLARPVDAQDHRTGGQRRADALTELARRALEGGRLPQAGGVRPQLTVTVDLDSLLGRPGAVGGDMGGVGPLDPEGCQRLACDGAVTRVLITRHPSQRTDPSGDEGPATENLSEDQGLGAQLRAAVGCCRRCWVGRPGSRWRWGGPPGLSSPPSAPPWPSAMAAVCSPAVPGPWPGVKPITWSIGCMAAPPTWRTWPCCAGPIIGRCMRGAGG